MRVALIACVSVIFGCEASMPGVIGGPPPTDAADVPIDGHAGVPDGAASPDGTVAIDAAPTIDAGPACGMAPTGGWHGVSRIQMNGGGSYTYVEADLSWTLASSAGCVDTFAPSGVVRYGFVGGETPDDHQATVRPGDGMLIIDRTSALATYQMSGATEPAGVWADQSGAFDGDVFAGGFFYQTGRSWQLTRDAAPPPPSGCVEAASDHWQTTTTIPGSRASAQTSWTRSQTDGCIDTFTPSGTAYVSTETGGDPSLNYDPDHGAIDPTDGTLQIDRTTAPARFSFQYANSVWPAQLVRTYADGTVTREDGQAFSNWSDGLLGGAFDGDAFAASIPDGTAYTFTRGP